MKRSPRSAPNQRDGQRGQILVVAVLAMIAMIGGVALVLEGGNIYAHQRMVQNSADAVANAGALVLASELAGIPKTDADVAAAMTTLSDSNTLDSHGGYYTDWKGQLLTSGGTPAPNTSAAAKVGDGVIPPLAQGVQAGGTDSFGTTFGRVIGFDQFAASAEATAVAGPLTGGALMPIIFPVNIVDCDTNGDLGSGRDNYWKISEPGNPPVGQEYIVPMCKTGSGSFMVLDLDGVSNNCDEEVANPPKITFAKFPATVASDNGNNCAKPMVDEVNKKHGEIVLIPICDDACVTTNGSAAEYHITKVAAFWLDYMADQDSSNHNPDCQGNGTTLKTIAGNGSSSCLVGYFIRYITTGSVGEGPITGASAAGVQLIR